MYLYDWFDRGAKPSHLYLRKLRSWDRSVRLIISHHLRSQRRTSSVHFSKENSERLWYHVSSLDFINGSGQMVIPQNCVFPFCLCTFGIIKWIRDPVDIRHKLDLLYSHYLSLHNRCLWMFQKVEPFPTRAWPWFDHPLSCQCWSICWPNGATVIHCRIQGH